MDAFVAQVKAATAVAKAADWPEGNMMVYMFDEASTPWNMLLLNTTSALIKKALPHVRIGTCGRASWLLYSNKCHGFWQSKYGCWDNIDVFVPQTQIYTALELVESEAYKRARTAHKQVWYYSSGIFAGPNSLDSTVEIPAMRSRLLVGTIAFKHKVDGFLYYRINGWPQYHDKPMHPSNTTSTLDVNDVLYKDESWDGMGQLLLPGSAGPLSTLPFEAHRDGFEDHALLTLLRYTVGNATKAGVNCSAEAEALEIPSELGAPAPWCSESLSNGVAFCSPKKPLVSDDPGVLLQHRAKVVSGILSCRSRIEDRI